MKYRVGDIVLDMDKYKAVIIQVKGYGEYVVKHKDGTGYVRTVDAHRLSMIQPSTVIDIGDKVLVKSSKLIGTVTATTTASNGKLTECVVNGVGQFDNPMRHLKLLRRSEAGKEEGYVKHGKRVRITKKGTFKHGFHVGDVCRVDDYMSMIGKTAYLLVRERDGFEQVVDSRAFEPVQDSANVDFTPANEIIDMVYAEVEEVGTPIKFEEGYKGEWFPVILRFDFHFYGRHFEKGSEFKAREAYENGELKKQVYISYERKPYMNDNDFNGFFYKKEEDEEMATQHDYEELKGKQELAKVDEEKKTMEAQIAELQAETERLRKENVAKEFGIVEKNHLWAVTILIPARTKFMPRSMGGAPEERSTEVVTEGQNMVEAAMVAEGMAKGISENAVVLSVAYQRVLGAIK